MTSKDRETHNLPIHANPIQPRGEDAPGNHALNHEDIRRRAYEIYLERGGLSGRELEDWFQAEGELRSAALFMRAATGEKHRP